MERMFLNHEGHEKHEGKKQKIGGNYKGKEKQVF